PSGARPPRSIATAAQSRARCTNITTFPRPLSYRPSRLALVARYTASPGQDEAANPPCPLSPAPEAWQRSRHLALPAAGIAPGHGLSNGASLWTRHPAGHTAGAPEIADQKLLKARRHVRSMVRLCSRTRVPRARPGHKDRLRARCASVARLKG